MISKIKIHLFSSQRLLKDIKQLTDQIKKMEEESLTALSKAQELLDKAETSLVVSVLNHSIQPCC